ncbi:MAG: tetratricopeptide repeat protein [Actinomycetia bacterium]|nr:tetratricopeptide repeat protein [Actinomycetes bacterium]
MQSYSYEQATIAYNSGEYARALEGYFRCLKEDQSEFESGDKGLVYHRLGNCLIKVKRYEEAVAAYHKSLEDSDYSERGSIHVNMGTAFSALGRYDEAIEEYHAALDDRYYPTPYRAWMGMGNALSKLKRIVEAGTAYRTAALDENNPNPVKALMNLGASFCTLDRPADAIKAYLAILDFRVTGATLHKTYERLGAAYFLDAQYDKAIQAFNDAQMGADYQISDRSRQQLREAKAHLAETDSSNPRADADTDADTDDSSHSGQDMALGGGEDGLTDGYQEPDSLFDDPTGLKPLDAEVSGPMVVGANIPSAENTGFFTATDAELIEAGKQSVKKEKKLRHTGLKVFLAVIVVVVLALAAAIVCYVQGVGYPSQQAVINRFFDAHAGSGSVTDSWVNVADDRQADFQRIVNSVVQVDSSKVKVIGMSASMNETTALVDVQLPEGGIVHYQINLVRDMIGWKINGIDLVFASTT